MPYLKPYLTIEQQIDLLDGRGMSMADRAKAAEYLRRIGEYVRGHNRMFDTFKELSLDAPMPGTTTPWIDMLASPEQDYRED